MPPLFHPCAPLYVSSLVDELELKMACGDALFSMPMVVVVGETSRETLFSWNMCGLIVCICCVCQYLGACHRWVSPAYR